MGLRDLMRHNVVAGIEGRAEGYPESDCKRDLLMLLSEYEKIRQELETRKTTAVAKSIITRKLLISESEAHRRLTRGAMNRRIPMRDLAQAIIDGREDVRHL